MAPQAWGCKAAGGTARDPAAGGIGCGVPTPAVACHLLGPCLDSAADHPSGVAQEAADEDYRGPVPRQGQGVGPVEADRFESAINAFVVAYFLGFAEHSLGDGMDFHELAALTATMADLMYAAAIGHHEWIFAAPRLPTALSASVGGIGCGVPTPADDMKNRNLFPSMDMFWALLRTFSQICSRRSICCGPSKDPFYGKEQEVSHVILRFEFSNFMHVAML